MDSISASCTLSLWQSVNLLVNAFADVGIALSSVRIQYDCCGGSCDVVYAYGVSKNIVRNHEVARIVSSDIPSFPLDIDKRESELKGYLFKLLSAIHGEGLANESGSEGYLLFHPSSALITGEHVQEQIAEDELGEYHPECKQVYVLSLKSEALEDDREIIEIQVPLG